MSCPEVTLSEIYQARKRIFPYCQRTPLIQAVRLSELVGARVYLKPEIMQTIGSFKVRGAANKILSLSDQEKERGVVTASTGNHGRAVSYIANRIGVQAAVCMSEDVPRNKVDAICRLGAEVVISGRSQDDAFIRAVEYQERDGKTMIHPFDDPAIIAGQGTIAVEIIEDLPRLGRILVPLSGGGLLAGITAGMKAINPSIQVIGVSMSRAPVMDASLKAGKPLQLPEEDTLADSLRGGIGLENQYTFRMVQSLVDEVVLVSEAEIAEGMAFAFENHHMIVEGAGAVGLAALLSGKVHPNGQDTAVVISGGNVEIATFLQTIQPYFQREE